MSPQVVPPEYLEKYRQALSKLYKINAESEEAFLSKLSYFEVKLDEVVTAEGEVEDYLYMVFSGGIRLFVNHNQKEVSTNFRFPGEFVSSIESFLARKPSNYVLKALEESILIGIKHADLFSLYDSYPEVNALGRVALENFFISQKKRVQDLLTLTAEERYQKLINNQLDYVQNIPLKHLASFLGITPESLSRIRAKRS